METKHSYPYGKQGIYQVVKQEPPQANAEDSSIKPKQNGKGKD